MLTEKDINIFTIVKDKNTISPLRRWCIDSWKKCMPEANIMIFDDSDLNNPNWKYYDVIKNDKLWNYYKNRTQFPSKSDSISPISTDSIRARLLKAIPNALFIDSDAYCNITSKEFLELCNKHYDTDLLLNETWFYGDKPTFAFCGYFAGGKNKLLDDVIEHYDLVGSTVKYDLPMISNVYDPKKHNIYMCDEEIKIVNHYRYHIGASSLRYPLVRFDFNPECFNMNCIVIKKYDKVMDKLSSYLKNTHPIYDLNGCRLLLKDLFEPIINKLMFKNKLCFFILDGMFTIYSGINFYSDMYYINNETNNVIIASRIYNIIDFDKKGLYNEFIQKLKETINIYFKPLLDNGKSINFYELEDLGDDPCLLKKI